MSLPPEANNNLISYHFIWIDQNRRQNVALMELIIISLEKIGPGDFFKEAKLRVMQWQSVCDSVWFRDFFVFSHFLSTQFLFFSKYKKRTWAGNENLPSPGPPPLSLFGRFPSIAAVPRFRDSVTVSRWLLPRSVRCLCLWISPTQYLVVCMLCTSRLIVSCTLHLVWWPTCYTTLFDKLPWKIIEQSRSVSRRKPWLWKAFTCNAVSKYFENVLYSREFAVDSPMVKIGEKMWCINDLV